MRSAEEILKTKSNGCAYEYSPGLHVMPYAEALDAMREYGDQFKPKWISVDKEHPENEGYYQTWVGGFSRPIELYYSEGSFKTTDRHKINVTHWMPLPEKP